MFIINKTKNYVFPILIVIMALGLFAALLYAGSSSINIDNYVIKSNKGVIESSAMTLATQFSAYENMKGYSLKESNWQKGANHTLIGPPTHG